MAQVALGVVLGEAALGWVVPNPTLDALGQIGVVLLLGTAGLELGVSRLREVGWPAFWVAVLGIVLSGGAGFAVAKAMGSSVEEAIYTGLVLTATSIGIGAQTLRQFGLVSHRVGQIVIAAAVIDDIIALFLLGAVHGAMAGAIETTQALGIVGLALPILGGIFWATRAAIRTIVGSARTDRSPWLTAAGLVLILAAGWLTHLFGLSAVVGAYFAGAGMSEALGSEARARHALLIKPIIIVLVPFFFVLIGARAQFDVLADPGMPMLLAGLVLAAVVGKLIGGVIGSSDTPFQSRLLIGLCMVPRGEVAMVIAGLGFAQQHISHHTFVILVMVAIITAISAPLLMTPLARKLVDCDSSRKQ